MTTSPKHTPKRLTATVPEAALIVGVSVSSIRRAIASGELEAITFGGRVLIPRPALSALLGFDIDAGAVVGGSEG